MEGRRGDLLIRAGECRKTLIFVLEGIVRAYYIKENGQEMTPFFWSEGLITASWESIYLNRASTLNFEMVEPGVLLTCDFVEFKKLVDQSESLRRTYMEMMETILTNTLIHVQSIQNEKPEDRYLHFINESPEVHQRIAQKHMASFLGITPISFSRMKKRLEK
jgi:CRP-like cAMP-binding protein